MCRSALEDLDRVAVGELHDRLLPVAACARRSSPCRFVLAALVRRPHARSPSRRTAARSPRGSAACRVGVHLEGVLAAILIRRRALLGDERPHDRAMKRRHRLLPLLLGATSSPRAFFAAASSPLALGRPSSPRFFAVAAFLARCLRRRLRRALGFAACDGAALLRARRRRRVSATGSSVVAERAGLDRARRPTRGCGRSTRRCTASRARSAGCGRSGRRSASRRR